MNSTPASPDSHTQPNGLWRRILTGGVVVAGTTIALGVQLCLLILAPVVDRIVSQPTDEPGQRRLTIAGLLVAGLVGVVLGAIARQLSPRYLRTRHEMPTVVTGADQGLVAALIALVLIALLTIVFDLRPVSGLNAMVSPWAAASFGIGIACGAAYSPSRTATTYGRTVAGDKRLIYRDEPIATEDVDVLHRQGLVSLLVSLLDEQRTLRASVVIGLDAEWGSGKTSLLNLMRRALPESQYLVVDFDPWDYAAPTLLLRALLNAIENAVSKRYLVPELGRISSQYIAALSPGMAKIGFTLDPFRALEVQSLRAAIGNITSKLRPHVVVILDDLDRLDENELLNTLRLLKLSADFPNMTYMVAIDRVHVGENVLGRNRRHYLDKFIDVPIPVGALDVVDFLTYFERESTAILSRLQRPRLIGKERVLEAFRQHTAAAPTLRDIKRILSAFSLALELLPGEVNVADVLHLEILRHIAPRAWISVMEHEDYLTWVPDQYFRRGDKDWNAARFSYYKSLEGMADEPRQQTVREILRALFPFVGMDPGSVKDASPGIEELRDQRVSHYLYFPRYFLYRVLPGTTPDGVLNQLIAELNEPTVDPLAAIRTALARDDVDATQLFDRLIARADEIDPNRRTVIAVAVATSSEQLEAETPGLGVDSERDRVRAFVFSLAAREQDGPRIQQLLEAVVRDTPSLVFAADTSYFSSPQNNHIITQWGHVDHEQLATVFDERASRELVGTGVDIVDMYGRWWPRITATWRDQNAKSEYLRQLVSQNPGRLGDILSVFRRQQLPPWRATPAPFDLVDLSRHFDVTVVRKLVDEMHAVDAADTLGHAAIHSFADAFDAVSNAPTATIDEEEEQAAVSTEDVESEKDS